MSVESVYIDEFFSNKKRQENRVIDQQERVVTKIEDDLSKNADAYLNSVILEQNQFDGI